MQRRAAGAMTALAIALTAACGGSSGSSAKGGNDFATNATLTSSVSADPGALDPHLTVLGATIYLNGLTYDYMTHVTKDGKLRPSVASKWDVTPTSVTFTVRDDVPCSDGTKLTPSVMAKSFAFVLDPKNKAP